MSVPCTTRLVGRQDELARVRAALSLRGVVSVVGAPGVGKTRVLFETARREAERFPGATYYVDLGHARTRLDARLAFARAFGVDVQDDADPADLERALKTCAAACERTLVLVDGPERVAGDVARWLEVWRAAAPGLSVVVGTRVRLAIDGEETIELLPLPTAGGAGSDAARLFVESATEVFAVERMSEEDREHLAGLVSDLQGLPLPIVLAAKRMGALPVRELRERVRASIGFLSDDEVTRGSLRIALLGSWEVLDPGAQHLLACASVFQGSFDLSALRAVADVSEAVALDGLRRLRDHSLVTIEQRSLDRSEGVSLYRVVRAFAAERRRERADAAAVLARYEEQRAELASRAAETDPDRLALGAAEADLESILDRAVAVEDHPGALAIALRCFVGLGFLYFERSPTDAFLAKTTRLLALLEASDPTSVVPPAVRANALLVAARVLRRHGLFTMSETAGARAADVARAVRGRAGARLAASTAIESALLDVARGRLDRALECLDAAAPHAERDPRVLGQLELARLACLHRGGAYEAAEAKLPMALERSRASGSPEIALRVDVHHAMFLVENGRIDDALSAAARIAAVATELGIGRLVAVADVVRGAALLDRADIGGARTAFDAAAEAATSAGHVRVLGLALRYRAHVDHLEGAVDSARQGYETAIGLLVRSDPSRSKAVAGLAAVLADLGCADEAIARMNEAFADALRSAPLRVRAAIAVLATHVQVVTRIDVAAGGARWDCPEGDPARSSDLRLFRRIRSRAFSRTGSDERALVIDPQARWFRPPGSSDQVSLQRQRMARQFVTLLLRRRRERPGGYVSREELERALWPDARLPPSTTANRLFVLASKMRHLGLGDVLESGQEGWRLATDVPVLESDGR